MINVEPISPYTIVEKNGLYGITDNQGLTLLYLALWIIFVMKQMKKLGWKPGWISTVSLSVKPARFDHKKYKIK